MAASVWMTWSMVKRFGAVMSRWTRAHDPGRDGAVEPERVADRDDRVAHGDLVGVAELKRGECARGGVHAQHCEVRGRVGADDLGLDRVTVREAHRDLVGTLDDVVVRDDVARLVDDEAGSEGRRLRGRRALIGRDDAWGERRRAGRGVDAHHAGRGTLVDLVDAQPGRACRRQGWPTGSGRLRDDGRVAAVEPSEERNRSDRDDAAERRRCDERGNWSESTADRHHSTVIARWS